MPIKVTCECGQGFSAKEHLAGRTLKCPKCGTRLKIPQPKPPEQPAGPKQRQQPAPKPTQPVPRPQQPQPKPPEQPPLPTPIADGMADLLGEADVDGAAPPTFCPECRTVMSQGAVLCTNCGYNTKLRRRMETKREAADVSPTRTPSERRGWIMVEAGLSISFFSLIIGVTAFAIIAIVTLVAMEEPTAILRVFTEAGVGGRFLAVILPWCGLAFGASYVSLITGWLVCRAAPERTEAHSRIQGTIGCVGATLLLVILMQLIPTMLMPSMPEPPKPGELRTLAEMQKAEAERQDAMRRTMKRREYIAKTTKVLFWLVWLALIGSYAAFGFFLGGVGRHFRRRNLPALGLYFGILQAVSAVWVTLLFFAIKIEWWQTMGKPIVIFSILLVLATYGWLSYIVYQARQLVRANS